MRYAGIIKNDIAAAPGICVSFYTQGCPHRCRGCHNPGTWDFDGGKEFTYDTIKEVVEALTANGVERTLCILGGEPMCDENTFLVDLLLTEVKKVLPNVKVYLWTGYYYNDLIKRNCTRTSRILKECNVIVDGPYVEELRDITLPLRGSSNQSVINVNR